MPGTSQKCDWSCSAFSPHPCSEKDSPQFVRKLWDAVERLCSSQRGTPWCFLGSSWNVRVWLQSLSGGARDAECVIVRNCSGAEQSLPHHLKEIWFSPGHSPFSALAVAGHFCTIFFILVEVEGNFSKTILFLFIHPTVLTLSWGWRAIGTDLAVVMIDRHLNPFLAQ